MQAGTELAGAAGQPQLNTGLDLTRQRYTANSAMAGFNAAGMGTEQALSQINRMIDQQAYMLAANDVFFGSALIFLLLIPFVWVSRPIRAGKGATAASADAAAGAH